MCSKKSYFLMQSKTLYLHLYKLLTKNCKRKGWQYMQLNGNTCISLSCYKDTCTCTIKCERLIQLCVWDIHCFVTNHMEIQIHGKNKVVLWLILCSFWGLNISHVISYNTIILQWTFQTYFRCFCIVVTLTCWLQCIPM